MLDRVRCGTCETGRLFSSCSTTAAWSFRAPLSRPSSSSTWLCSCRTASALAASLLIDVTILAMSAIASAASESTASICFSKRLLVAEMASRQPAVHCSSDLKASKTCCGSSSSSLLAEIASSRSDHSPLSRGRRSTSASEPAELFAKLKAFSSAAGPARLEGDPAPDLVCSPTGTTVAMSVYSSPASDAFFEDSAPMRGTNCS
mmetsp:Transcript_30649/g.72939  ORF Transcript_30649/g.72939 Transcript_30649/m.72939 type:complete len:204 (-) Transcript_30649:285-896(-)